MRKVAVIGAGITGLAAAFELRRREVDCTLFEATGRAGGAIETVREGGFLAECGPNSILDTHPDIGNFLADAGLDAQKLPAGPKARKRFIVRNGRPVALPDTPPAFLASKAFSAKAKLRLMREPFIRSRSNPSESLAEFVVRRLGREFLDYAIDPFVGGVYAGDPARLSTACAFPRLYALEREYGSLILGAARGARKRRKRAETAAKDAKMFSFSGGMETLPRHLARLLGGALRLNHPVGGFQRLEDGRWAVSGEAFSDLVLAIPAYALARLDAPFDLAPLGGIDYPPVASLSLGFKRKQVSHPLDGFGVLVPGIENRFMLGALFPSSIFPGRAPEGAVLLTAFAGGARFPERALLPEGELAEKVLADLRDLLGLSGTPVFRHLALAKRAIPQYVVGYERHLELMGRIEAAHPGIHFAGHYRDGISVGNSLLSGLKVARRIVETPEPTK